MATVYLFRQWVLVLLVATAFVHVGRVRIKRASEPSRKHFSAAIFFGLALVLMLASMPWPFSTAGRPMIRGI